MKNSPWNPKVMQWKPWSGMRARRLNTRWCDADKRIRGFLCRQNRQNCASLWSILGSRVSMSLKSKNVVICTASWDHQGTCLISLVNIAINYDKITNSKIIVWINELLWLFTIFCKLLIQFLERWWWKM